MRIFWCHLLPLVAILCVTCCHLLHHSLSLVVTRYRLLLHFITRYTTPCHLMSLVVPLTVARCITRLSSYKRS